MEKVNNNIHCSVNTCAHHAAMQDCCTLSSITVGCCNAQPKSCDCTECASFQAKGSSCGCR